MANSNRGNKNRDVEPVVVAPLAVEAVEAVAKKEAASKVVEPRVTSGDLHPRVQATLDSAMKDGKVKIKSKANYDAAKAVLKAYNPKNLTLVHKPNLGHHSIAVR